MKKVDDLLLGLCCMRYDGYSGIRYHIGRVMDIFVEVMKLGVVLNGKEKLECILNTLPSEFSNIKCCYIARGDKLSLCEVLSMCVYEDERLMKERLSLICLNANLVPVMTCQKDDAEFKNTYKRDVGGTSESSGLEFKKTDQRDDVEFKNIHQKDDVEFKSAYQRDDVEFKNIYQRNDVEFKSIHQRDYVGTSATSRKWGHGMSPVRCNFCDKYGHLKKECSKRKRWFTRKGLIPKP